MNNNEFNEDPVDFDDSAAEGGFEDFEGGGATLGDMWRNNPLVKIGVIAGGLITVIGAVILFGGSSEPPPPPVPCCQRGTGKRSAWNGACARCLQTGDRRSNNPKNGRSNTDRR